MKKINQVLICGILLMSIVIVFSGCKKKADTVTYPSVTFLVSSTPVTFNTGEAGLTFFANCNSTDVKMTKVEILDPLHSGTVTYNLNGLGYVTGQIFALQDANTGYLKSTGTWQFTFTGLRTVDNAPFTVVSNLNVSK